MTDNVSSPKLKHFRQILFWPLRLIPSEGVKEKIEEDGFALTIKNILTQSPHWKAQNDLYGRGMNPDPVTSYAEFVYFHPFIRRFLYGDPRNENENALHICQRTDVKTIQITTGEDKTFEFNVDRVHLYLFAIEVTLLVIEISSIELTDMELEDVENVLDQFRHAYPPYWENGKAGHSPKRVLFFDENKHQVARSEYNNQQSYLNFVEKQKTSPVAEHWHFLLEPFVPHTFHQKEKVISYEQIEDGRIPHFAFLAFDDPTLLTKGDFMRLTFADAWGESDTLPYSPDFLENFEAKYCYDRFWKESKSPNQNPKYNWMTTRYLCCGYAFTMIGQDKGFFTDSTAGRLADFRHHYFQMGLIVHFHKAALLMLWDELAQAVANFSKHPQQFRQQVDKILEKLLHFTHRYWFTEVSNHVQPKELFDMWSEHLGSRELFNRLMKEVQDTQQYLDMREQKQQTETTNRLTVVATIGLGIALTLGVFGGSLQKIWGSDAPTWEALLIVFGAFGLGILVTLSFSQKLSHYIDIVATKRLWCSIWQWLKKLK